MEKRIESLTFTLGLVVGMMLGLDIAILLMTLRAWGII